MQRLVGRSLTRFRFGDGFSHSRALGLQLSLAAVPLIIAAVGLSSSLKVASARRVMRETMLGLTPGASQALLRRTLSPFAEDSDVNVVALVLGLLVATLSLTTAMGQIERGANRIYGVQRDRPTMIKYSRAAALAAAAGLPAMAGFVLLVVADAFSEAVEQVYGLSDDAAAGLTRPVGVLLVLAAIAVMLRFSPHRRQPGWSLLAVGGLVGVAASIALTALLGAFLQLSGEVGSVYGPLTGVMALLLWAQLTAGALFVAFAVSAELEVAAAAAQGGQWLHPDAEADG